MIILIKDPFALYSKTTVNSYFTYIKILRFETLVVTGTYQWQPNKRRTDMILLGSIYLI